MEKTEMITKILEKVKKDEIRFINLQFSDIIGTVKNVTIQVERLEEALNEGVWFDGSSIQGFTRIHESDMYLMPDMDTYAVIPWYEGEHKSCRFICDVYMPDGSPFEGDPRYILKRAMAEAKKLGYTYKTGPELEFFLFKKSNGQVDSLPHDKGAYFDLVMDEAYEVRQDMIVALEKIGIVVESSHHEVAAGQHEICFRYDDALKTADNALTLKFTLKAIAQKHGLYVSFMPKPISGINGSGMHVHQSLFDSSGENVFYDGTDSYGLSNVAYGFIAGQMKHIKEIVAVTNPLVNSYKRLVPGYEASTYICWARINRSALIRIPRISPEKKKGTRCEIRCPDPSSNTYLAFAALLSAGLEGVKKKLVPPESVEEDVFEYSDVKLKEKGIDYLPSSLSSAICTMKKSELAKKILGDHTYEHYIRAKTAEYDSFRLAVTDWEIKRYMESV